MFGIIQVLKQGLARGSRHVSTAPVPLLHAGYASVIIAVIPLELKEVGAHKGIIFGKQAYQNQRA